MSGTANIEAYKRALDAAQRHAPDGSEYWLARELQAILNYKQWDNFFEVVRKAMMACERSGQSADHHFRQTTKMVALGSGSKRKIPECLPDCDEWRSPRG